MISEGKMGQGPHVKLWPRAPPTLRWHC